MDKEFVSYEQALALKELGFEYEKFYNYTSPMTNLAPLKQQVFRWFREKYDVDCYITRMLPNVVNRDLYHVVLNDLWAPNDSYKNYEDAESRLIDNLIELAKQQDNDKI